MILGFLGVVDLRTVTGQDKNEIIPEVWLLDGSEREAFGLYTGTVRHQGTNLTILSRVEEGREGYCKHMFRQPSQRVPSITRNQNNRVHHFRPHRFGGLCHGVDFNRMSDWAKVANQHCGPGILPLRLERVRRRGLPPTLATATSFRESLVILHRLGCAFNGV